MHMLGVPSETVSLLQVQPVVNELQMHPPDSEQCYSTTAPTGHRRAFQQYSTARVDSL